ncbi:MAG: YlxR family protein [Candidatus Nanopelagicales bacterium]|nr:YlxR family protein [Candidatus Nanopelagicales bacterium]
MEDRYSVGLRRSAGRCWRTGLSGYTGRIGSHVPVRTCVGCRRRGNQSDLLRAVARGSDLIPDDSGRQPGRGAYLHPDLECLALAERRRAWTRALRVTGPLSSDALGQVLRQKTAVDRRRRRDELPMTTQP